MLSNGPVVRPEDIDLFHLSLERCLADRSFLSRFYARFLLSSDEIAAKFAGVDLDRQAKMLRSSIYLVVRAAAGHEDGLAHLEDIARSHSTKGHDIPPRLYGHWLECLLQAASETDPCFDENVAAVWRRVLAPCIEVMSAFHGRP